MLGINSQVKELKLYDNQVETSLMVSELMSCFRSNPSLPGIIIWEDNKIIAVISQKLFWQYMSRPYSLELSSKRSIKYLLDFVKIQRHFVVSGDMLITEAAKKSLERVTDVLDEPILVKITRQEYRLLDVRQLLVAYAQIHELTMRSMSEMNNKLEKANHTLEQVLKLDPITGLGTKCLLDKYLNREWKRAVKEKTWLSLITCDLDYFQEYSSIHGKLAADKCLGTIGNLIKNAVKRSGDLAIHYGEGKFSIVLPKTSVVEADILADNILQKIKELEIVNPQSQIHPHLTMSLGVASIKPCISVNSDKQKILITIAEQALDRAKHTGRNRKIVWNNYYGERKTVSDRKNDIPTLIS